MPLEHQDQIARVQFHVLHVLTLFGVDVDPHLPRTAEHDLVPRGVGRPLGDEMIMGLDHGPRIAVEHDDLKGVFVRGHMGLGLALGLRVDIPVGFGQVGFLFIGVQIGGKRTVIVEIVADDLGHRPPVGAFYVFHALGLNFLRHTSLLVENLPYYRTIFRPIKKTISTGQPILWKSSGEVTL